MILLKYLWINAPSIFFIALLVRVSDYRECKPMFVKDNLAIRTSDDIEGTKKKSVFSLHWMGIIYADSNRVFLISYSNRWRLFCFYLGRIEILCLLSSFSSRCWRTKFLVNMSQYSRVNTPSTFVKILLVRFCDYWKMQTNVCKDIGNACFQLNGFISTWNNASNS